RMKGAAAMEIALIVVIILAVLSGAGIYAFHITSGKRMLAQARLDAEQVRENARREADNKAKEIELAAKQEQLKRKEAFERENEAARRKLEDHESRLAKR